MKERGGRKKEVSKVARMDKGKEEKVNKGEVKGI
jgi:hypothetical protein